MVAVVPPVLLPIVHRPPSAPRGRFDPTNTCHLPATVRRRRGRGDHAGSTCAKHEADGATQRNTESLGATSAVKVVDNRTHPRMGKRPRQHGRFASAEIPAKDAGRNLGIVDSHQPRRLREQPSSDVRWATCENFLRNRRWDHDRFCRLAKQIGQASPAQTNKR